MPEEIISRKLQNRGNLCMYFKAKKYNKSIYVKETSYFDLLVLPETIFASSIF